MPRSRADTALRAAATVTVVGLAGIAGAISYSHMTELAQAHGETGWRSHMFPLSVDGIEIIASLVLLADRRAGRRSGRLPWAALITGTAASVAANLAVGGSDWVGRAISGWPALALLVTIKLLVSLLDHPSAMAPDQKSTRTSDPPAIPKPTDQRPSVSPLPGPALPTPADSSATRDHDNPSQHGDSVHPTPTSHRRPPGPTMADVSALLPAARAAHDTLADQGEPLTRAALSRQMRADGHPVSTARASALLKALNSKPLLPTTSPPPATRGEPIKHRRHPTSSAQPPAMSTREAP